MGFSPQHPVPMATGPSARASPHVVQAQVRPPVRGLSLCPGQGLCPTTFVNNAHSTDKCQFEG